MSYDNAIETYNLIYEKVDLPTIVDLWSANQGDLHVYVHSPFCASICRFCYYKGVEFSFDKDTDTYDRFYSEYLPSAVAPFQRMLEARTVGNYFFGGGTPSLMKPDTMRSVFDLFPGMREVPSKTFEIHPALWTEEQLDLLAEYGFNCCIIGIQSFDADVLARQRRIHAPFDRIHELSKQIQSRGMLLAVDLIHRMDEVDADAIFQKDLELVGHLDADVISLQLNYDLVQNDEYNNKFFELILGSGLSSKYYWEGGDEINLNMKKTLKCFRYLKQSIPREDYIESIFPFTKTIDEASKVAGHDSAFPSVIGFGSYRNPRKNTFSNIRDPNRTIEYIEVNNNWLPEYFITFRREGHDFYDECQRQFDMMRELGPLPKGMQIVVGNKTATARENYIYRQIESPVEISVQWAYSSPETERFIEGLKRIFPHWTWRAN